MFFLMKMDKRLRLQIFFLVLILGACILPDKTAEALKCHKCSPGCEDKTIEENCKTGACLKTTYVNGSAVIIKGCAEYKQNGPCALEKFSGKCFVNTEENTNNFLKCVTGLPPPSWDDFKRKDFGTTKTCYCDTDLCNDEGDTGMTAGAAGTNNKTGAGNKPSFGTRLSSSKELALFFIVAGAATAGVLMKA